MSVIIPRWEWRTFGQGLDAAAERLSRYPVEQERHSDEVYILSAASDENTKIRHELVDVKVLLQTSEAGLEQWRPALKLTFPLDRGMLRELFASWELETPVGLPAVCHVETLLRDVVAPHPALRAVRVHKRRFGATIDGCIVERAELTFDDVPIRTMAVEHEDPQRVLATLARLGLAGRENINYVRALKRFAGLA